MNGLDLKKNRERLGLTQQELAEKLQISRKTINSYENGSNIPPSRVLLFDSFFHNIDAEKDEENAISVEKFKDVISEVKFLYKVKQSEISAKIGVKPTYLSDMINGRVPVTENVLQSIYEHFSSVKKNKYGVYEQKTTEEIKEELENLPSGGLRIKEYPTKLAVRLVTNKAQAGWSEGFYADEYLEDMPIVMIDADQEYKGKYLAFEVVGDSMEPDYMEGDIVICREVQRSLWSYKLHFKDWDFVIAHNTQGIMLKEIIAHDVEKGIITCHSINPNHKDFKVNLREVTYLYNVVEVRQKGRRKRWNRAKDFYEGEE